MNVPMIIDTERNFIHFNICDWVFNVIQINSGQLSKIKWVSERIINFKFIKSGSISNCSLTYRRKEIGNVSSDKLNILSKEIKNHTWVHSMVPVMSLKIIGVLFFLKLRP